MNISKFSRAALALCLLLFAGIPEIANAATYEVGPGRPFETPSDVPWEFLSAGDTVLIYWRSTPYKDKWVISREGTQAAPIVVRGVFGPAGERPVIDGNGAVTRRSLDYWNENRGVVKIGGSSVPADVMPKHIVIENLEIRSARPGYSFVDDHGSGQGYIANAAAIYIEKGEFITLRNNRLRDSGNGLFVGSPDPGPSRSILVESNDILENGNVGSAYEHNVYTEALGITFQFNHLGKLRAGAGGNNLKDRSAGLVVRFNWIEGGNRQLDLVDTGSAVLQSSPAYRETRVYGNVLLETETADNRQITHYGGDSGSLARYRKGTLYFYNNTVVSYRTDRTTAFAISSNEERIDARNNVFYVTAGGSTLSLLDSFGRLDLLRNWFQPGRVTSFGSFTGVLNDDGTSLVGNSPGFRDEAQQDFHPTANSPLVNAGMQLPVQLLTTGDVVAEYVKHLGGRVRARDGFLDLGAFELDGGGSEPDPLAILTSSVPDAVRNVFYAKGIAVTGGEAPYTWRVVEGRLPYGMWLGSRGIVMGWPVYAGTWTFTVEVSSQGQTATRPLAITVRR